MENYIPHSLIKDIYPDLTETDGEPIILIRLKNDKKYKSEELFTIDANGISGNFKFLK
jgi:hypothetical protein